MTSKILFVTQFPAAADAAREMVPAGYELIIADPKTKEYKETLPEAEYLVGFVDMLINRELFETGRQLRLIQLLSAGYDSADLEAATTASIPIANNGGANSVAVSEHALMLMLATSRQLIRQHSNMENGLWRGNGIPRLYELRERVLGIIGLGSIGKKTARLALAFGMKVHYFDIARLSESEEDDLGVRFRLLGELLSVSDVVSLHVPLNASTKHMINRKELAAMKATAILINTSRGPVIEERALIDALSGGTISAAGLDVYDQEPPQPENPLLKLKNVVLTAHMAGPTIESNTVRVRNAFDNVQRVSRGEKPLWVIPELEIAF